MCIQSKFRLATPTTKIICNIRGGKRKKRMKKTPATLDESSTMRPPPSAPPDTWSRAFTKTYMNEVYVVNLFSNKLRSGLFLFLNFFGLSGV